MMFDARRKRPVRRKIQENIYLSVVILSILPATVVASNLPLLSGTLRTFQVHACDGDELRIECFPDTVISIYLAQYGRNVPSYQLCPPELAGESYFLDNDTTNCFASEALRYSFLQTIEAACREQQVCQLTTSPESFGSDPCPGVRKYAEVAFKCRPSTFYNKIVCEGDRLRLRCHKSLRIVIYSAAFGGTHYGVAECPQPKDSKNQADCQVSYATETVMSSCHGRRKCSIGADVGTFGNPSCPKGNSLFLKVVYTCVPREILKDLDLGGSEDGKDQPDDSDYTGFIEAPRYVPVTPTSADRGLEDSKFTPSFKYVPDLGRDEIRTTQKTDIQSDENIEEEFPDVNCTVVDDQKVIGFLTEWISAYNFIKENKEKFILYLTLSLGAGLLTFMVVLAVRLYILKRKERKRANLNITDTIPTAFGEDGSDLDHFDTSDRPDNGVDVIRYGTNRSTMRRQDSDTYPRAPMGRSLNNYYYS
ncbi:protein eva-1-like isoform X1 [Centruroides vittatus]|uniref:protein eva-1-like isoform X1 n=1 Tax=Centruroides vittatus TaxID=120091 RepID=UPI00350EE536